MPFTLEQFVKLRPFAWHLTARSNLPLIKRSGRLLSAECLAARTPEAIAKIRTDITPVRFEGETVLLRDQKPLRPNQIIFESGWTVDDLRQAVNRHVFFWPGFAEGPIAQGQNHFECYADAGDVALRVPMVDLLATNDPPKFYAFNSGAPAARARSRRGPETFVPADQFLRTAGKVVELVFQREAVLPRFEVMRPVK